MVLQTIARILADKLNLAVEYSSRVSTFLIKKNLQTGQMTVVMSTQVLELVKGNEEATKDLTLGAIVHEALGHGYHTDFSASVKKGKYADSLAGGIEDVMIENAAPNVFIGARRLLRKMVAALLTHSSFWSPMPQEDWQGNLVNGLIRKHRHGFLGQPIDPAVTEQILDSVRAVLGLPLLDQIDAVFEKGYLSGNSHDVCAAADEIVGLLEAADLTKPAQSPPEQNEKPDGISPDKDGEQESRSEGSGSKDENGEEASDTADSGSSTEPQGSDEGEMQNGSGGAAENQEGAETSPSSDEDSQGGKGAGDSPAPFDPNAHYDVGVEEAVAEATGDSGNPMYKSTGETIREPSTASLQDSTEYTPDPESRSMLLTMNRRIEDSLRWLIENRCDLETDTGMLDMTRLVEASKGFTDKPFIEEQMPAEGMNTEILFLVDASGSMKNLGTPFVRSLIYSALTSMAIYAPDLRISLAFFETCAKWVILPGTNVTPSVIRKASGLWLPGGGTNWISSIPPLVPSIAASDKSRKVIFTLTDGQFPLNQDRGVLKDVRELGIECQFLCIGNEPPTGFPGARCEETPQSVADGFCDLLLKSKDAVFATKAA